MMQEGGTIDPVSGNEVPVGSMQEEVRDDIDAKLSEGEFVFPADVVRFIGLEKLMKIRDQAKQGLQRMEEMGQMGNAEEVGASPDEMFEDDDNFESELDSVMSEVEAEEGVVKEFAAGGFLSGLDLERAPKNPMIDTRYFKHADGRVMYIVFVNDKPSTKIPEGFEPMDGPVDQLVGKEAEEKAAISAGLGGGEGGPGPGLNEYVEAYLDAGGGEAGMEAQQAAQYATLLESPKILGLLETLAPGHIGKLSQSWYNVTYGKTITDDKGWNDLAGDPGSSPISDPFSDAPGTGPSAGSGPGFDPEVGDPSIGGGSSGGSGTSIAGIDFGAGVDPEAGSMGLGATVGNNVGLDAFGGAGPSVGGGSSSSSGSSSTSSSSSSSVGLDAFGGDGPSIGGVSGGSASSSSSAADAAAVADAAASVEGAGIAAAGGGDGAAGDGGGPCFITTAAVEHNNEPDEGKLLTTLRKFRDNYMKKDPEKMKDVEWYYDNAPAIVKGLNNLKNSKVVYNRIYQQYLRPAMKAIEEGDNKKAYTIYKNVMKYSAEKAGVKEKSLEKQVDNKKKGIASRNKDVS
jgi:hypothetical protein